MKIYVAAAYELREAALALMRRLENERHEITWKWPVHETDEVTPRQMAEKEDVGTFMLNSAIQARWNPEARDVMITKARVGIGDRVINTVNDWDRGLANGEIGEVISTNPSSSNEPAEGAPPGTNHPRARFTRRDIRRIRRLAEDGDTTREIAELISAETGRRCWASTVGKIVRGESYAEE